MEVSSSQVYMYLRKQQHDTVVLTGVTLRNSSERALLTVSLYVTLVSVHCSQVSLYVTLVSVHCSQVSLYVITCVCFQTVLLTQYLTLNWLAHTHHTQN